MCENGFESIVYILFEKGVVINWCDNCGYSFFMVVCLVVNDSVVCVLFER